jgi:hypothetical protein
MLKTLVTVRGLEVLLLSKEVAMPSDISLGVVTAIKKELSQDKIWMVIKNQSQEIIIPIEQIASVTNKVVLFDNLLSPNLTMSGNLSASPS